MGGWAYHDGIEGDAEDVHDTRADFFGNVLGLDGAVGRVEHADAEFEEEEGLGRGGWVGGWVGE